MRRVTGMCSTTTTCSWRPCRSSSTFCASSCPLWLRPLRRRHRALCYPGWSLFRSMWWSRLSCLTSSLPSPSRPTWQSRKRHGRRRRRTTTAPRRAPLQMETRSRPSRRRRVSRSRRRRSSRRRLSWRSQRKWSRRTKRSSARLAFSTGWGSTWTSKGAACTGVLRSCAPLTTRSTRSTPSASQTCCAGRMSSSRARGRRGASASASAARPGPS
mmetsp:Transcript_107346/g.336362  ORF Transcript_107346/g.336362 Transcript_107346/m.336362 type:complete len:214 (-) Transcript_107346:273-914(-)